MKSLFAAIALFSLWLSAAQAQPAICSSTLPWRTLSPAQVADLGLSEKYALIVAAVEVAKEQLGVKSAAVRVVACARDRYSQFEASMVFGGAPGLGISATYGIYVTAAYLKMNDNKEITRAALNHVCRIYQGTLMAYGDAERQLYNNHAELCAAQIVGDSVAIEWLKKVIPSPEQVTRDMLKQELDGTLLENLRQLFPR